MIDLVLPARPWMAERMKLQQAQVLTGQAMTPENLEMAIGGGMALAGIAAGEIVGMAGVFERWAGVGVAWALLSEGFGAHRLSAFKLMKRALDVSPHLRVEAQVACGHEEGERLLRHLGFEKEGIMRKFWQGRDYSLFARVR